MRTLLLVDDEPTILTLASMALGRRYRVLTAPSAEEALALAGAEALDLLVTDHRMPGMTGVELLQALRATAPGLPCVLSTGFTQEAALQEALALGGVSLLHKPWGPLELRQAVEAALDG